MYCIIKIYNSNKESIEYDTPVVIEINNFCINDKEIIERYLEYIQRKEFISDIDEYAFFDGVYYKKFLYEIKRLNCISKI